MKKKFDIDGIWWLPENEDYKLNGILHYREDKEYILELFGELKVDPKEYKHPVINGHSSTGIGYTLVDCFLTSVETNIPGLSKTTIHVSTFFENLVAKKFDDIKLSSVSVSFSSLDNWVRTDGFSTGIGKPKITNVKDLIIKYCLPEKIENMIDNEFHINIKFIVFTPKYTLPQKKIRIKQKTEIEIVASDDRDLFYFLNKIMYFRHFLMLAINANTKKQYIKIKLANNVSIYTNSNKQAFFYIKDKAEDLQKGDVSPFVMILSYPSIKDRLSLLLNIWFKNHNNCYSAYTLFFETLYHKGLNLENHLLNLTQVLESYHRDKTGGEFMNKEEYKNTIYKKLTENLPTNIENDFRESLKSKIKYGYEFSLRRRLKEIFLQNNKFLSQFILDYETLINEIVETRNYYTHYDEKTKFVRQYSDLYELCEKIKVVFISLLLLDLGFPNEEVRHLIEYQEMTSRLINVSGYAWKP